MENIFKKITKNKLEKYLIVLLWNILSTEKYVTNTIKSEKIINQYAKIER